MSILWINKNLSPWLDKLKEINKPSPSSNLPVTIKPQSNNLTECVYKNDSIRCTDINSDGVITQKPARAILLLGRYKVTIISIVT